MDFIKMHGIGNDFILINLLELSISENQFAELSVKLCDRRFGIGSDGLIFIENSSVADYRMRMFNPDGSEAQMCGNGIRCFAKYLFDRKILKGNQFKAETGAGILSLDITEANGTAAAVQVDMGPSHLKRSEIPMINGNPDEPVVNESITIDNASFNVTAVSMGNPHAVIFTDDVDKIELEVVGPKIERHPSFPQRINVHFVQIINKNEIKMRTWERGAGITLACGTGACSCLVASVLNDKTERKALVHLPGGDLNIEWLENNHVMMTGPAVEVFKGEINL